MNPRPLVILLAACAVAWADGGVTLPITLEKNLPLAQVNVNGHDLTFIIDSAAEGCVIDGQRAREIGLTLGAPAISSGSGGRQAVELIQGARLDIGGIPIIPPHPITFDMAALKFQRRVDGILGKPLFAGRVIEIDYPSLTMRIIPPKAYRPGPGALVLPMRMTTGPTVKGTIRLRGRPPITADMQLDTGSAHVLTLCTAFVDRLNLLDSADDLKAGHTIGFGGNSPDMEGRIDEFRVGDAVVKKPLVRFSRHPTGSLATEEHYSANIGGGFLNRYKVAFDFPGARVVITRP